MMRVFNYNPLGQEDSGLSNRRERGEFNSSGRSNPIFINSSATSIAAGGSISCLEASRARPFFSIQHSEFRIPRRGFTFLEVLFSVIIIGIGFIMVAAMFPVAIQQSQQNVSEAAGVAVGRDALRYLQTVATMYVPPATTGTSQLAFPVTYNPSSAAANKAVGPQAVMPLPDALNTTVSPAFAYNAAIGTAGYAGKPNPTVLTATGSQVMTADRRYAWVGFYRRDLIGVAPNQTPAPYAQVWIFTAQCTIDGQPLFAIAPRMQQKNGNILVAKLQYSSTGSRILFTTYFSGMAYDGQGPVGDGAYVLVLNSVDSNLVGQVLRLGGNVSADATNGFIWNIAPGADLNPNDSQFSGKVPIPDGTALATTVNVFVLGKPLVPNPNGLASSPPLIYNGPVQDVTATTGFIRVNN
jgi:prepilin-type N-terminal cleavage/methylation domain-containing protein